MKLITSKTLMILALAASLSACGTMTPTPRNVVAGAAIGGAAGHLIGGDTASTLGGAAWGGVIGSQVNR